MSFPIDPKYIEETELTLGVEFPYAYKAKMEASNGGAFGVNDDELFLYPFPDKADQKRIVRTLTNIISETKSAKEWEGFPDNAVAIGDNGSGDILILLPSVADSAKLEEKFFIWRHESGEIEEIEQSIEALMSEVE